MPQRMMMRIVTNERMNMHYTIKRLYILLAAASVSLVGCKQEEVNSGGVEQRDPNLISVSFDMSAGVQETILEETPAKQGRALGLGYTLEDVTVNKGAVNEKTSYSVLKFDPNSAPKILEAYGIFYCPDAPEEKKTETETGKKEETETETGKKKGKGRVYISNGPMQWEKTVVDGSRVRYKIRKGGVVNVDRTLMDGKHQWYFAAVVGAEYDDTAKTFSFDPYKDARANGLTYQFNGEPINLNLPMTTSWSKLQVYAPESTNPDPWFYPEGYDVTKGQPDDVVPSVTFRPRGTVFRMRVWNQSINDLRIMSYNMESNAVAFKTTISPDDILGQKSIAEGGGKLKMTPVMDHPAEVLVFDRDGKTQGRVVKAGHESQSGVTLAWGFLNEAKQKELADNIGTKAKDETKASPEVPYLSVRATAQPADDDKWNSMQKAADYYPIENRVSYISQAPIFYAYVNDLTNHYKDGGSEWFRVRVTSSLTNLERTTFEVLNKGFTPGKAGSFKRGHPWMNRHSGGSAYWLDGVAYPDLAQLKTWMEDSRGFVGESAKDPDLVDHKGNILTNLRSTAKYYLPHAEELQSYLPIPVGTGKMDSVYLAPGADKTPFDVLVIEQDLNIKHRQNRGAVDTARFVLKGGYSEQVNAQNYGKDIKTGASLPMVGNENWSSERMAPYNYFNYFWCSHIVYGLAYLRKGDPESLVAYRYFWGISPEDTGVPLGNKYPSDNQWKGNDEAMNAVYGSQDAAILRDGIKNPQLGETLRRLSAWSGGRLGAKGGGKSMVSFFSVAMRHIGRQDPVVRSLGDIGIVSEEKWWTANPQNVVFRIFSAVGFADGKSTNDVSNYVDNRNRGVYILTQTNYEATTGHHDYFYIGPHSWGRFSTKDEATLSEMWLRMHANGGINYKAGGQTPMYSRTPYDKAPNQYQISKAFMVPRSGAPTHFMVGTDPKKP